MKLNPSQLHSLKGKLKKWQEHVSLRKQILAALLLITFCVTVVFGELAYNFAKSRIEQNYQKSHISSLNNTSKVLDLQMQSLIDIARNALNSTQLYTALNDAAADGGQEFGRTQQAVLRQTAYNMANLNGSINSIIFADLKGHCYMFSNIGEGSYSFYRYYQQHPLLKEAWAKTAIQASGKEVFFGCGMMGQTDSREISFVKYIINPKTGKPQGLMAVNVSKQILKKSLVNANDNYPTSCYFVVSNIPKETVVYYEGSTSSQSQDSSETQAVGLAYRDRANQQKYLLSEVQNETTGWVIANAIEKNALSQESKSIRMLVLITAVVIIALSLEVSNLIARSITKPLNLLENAIQSVGQGERHLTEAFDDSEVGQIGKKFEKMVNNNLELSERLLNAQINEREAQLLLLQAQINPHFLYNTLDSIYCLAIIHGDDKIAEMILALSSNFKLALNNGDKMITVENTIHRIKEYMKLQNMRYNNRFTLTVDVEEAILQKKIINFILQPFVENAIYHGLEPKIGKGSIRLEGKCSGENLIFTVSDDGIGIADPSSLERGYGVRNVRERIHLFYGEQYDVTVKSAVGKGTVVRIAIPVDRNRGGKIDAQSGSH